MALQYLPTDSQSHWTDIIIVGQSVAFIKKTFRGQENPTNELPLSNSTM